jgi:hypothetical protein
MGEARARWKEEWDRMVLIQEAYLKSLLYLYCENFKNCIQNGKFGSLKAMLPFIQKHSGEQLGTGLRGVRKAPWPPNFPDLHPIENPWDYEKDIIGDEPVYGASESEKRFKDLTAKEWLEIGRQGEAMHGHI